MAGVAQLLGDGDPLALALSDSVVVILSTSPWLRKDQTFGEILFDVEELCGLGDFKAEYVEYEVRWNWSEEI